jgi:hypothetical protein
MSFTITLVTPFASDLSLLFQHPTQISCADLMKPRTIKHWQRTSLCWILARSTMLGAASFLLSSNFRMFSMKLGSKPVQGHEMVINTGNHKPIAMQKSHCGMHEAPIMQRTVDKLAEMGFITLDSASPWGLRITVAPKPHQELVVNVEERIWRLCTNCI